MGSHFRSPINGVGQGGLIEDLAMELRDTVLRQLKNRREGFSLEQSFYTDPDYFNLDMETIWYRDWLFVGHDCEVPKSGNYMTVQVGAYSVVIVRGRDGQIRALQNSC